jgi:hypothetical protein
MLENVCNENNRSRLVGVERAGVSVDTAVLARYQGQYAFSAGSRTVAGFMGMKHTVTLVNGRLYLNALPLIPLSATMFESTGASHSSSWMRVVSSLVWCWVKPKGMPSTPPVCCATDRDPRK